MTSIQAVSQSLDLESPIDLFSISGNGIATPFYFCNVKNVVFNGQEYQAIPCEFEWLTLSSEGAVPTSRLIISDVSGIIGAIAVQYNLVGATLTAIRTYPFFLDTNVGSDPTQSHPPVKLRINKLTSDYGNQIELECITGFDIERRKIPGRAYLRRCSWILSDSNCQAPTNISFDLMGNPTSFENRACNKDFTSCQRYHSSAFGRRFGGFPASNRR
jgi:lambda family phage minor tail protein L